MLALKGKLSMAQATLASQTGKSKPQKGESQMLVYKDAE
jgi:hypothetical protein